MTDVTAQLPGADAMTNTDYVRVLRPLLPPQAFAADARKLIPAAIHVAIVIGGWFMFRVLPHYLWPLLGLVIGNSTAALAFIGHDISHRSVVKNRKLMYVAELIVWTLVNVPTTMWRRVHGSHHIHTNAQDDPDRRFLECELSPVTTAYAAMLFPNRTLRYNLLCFLHFTTYIARHTIVAFYPGKSKPKSMTAKPAYTVAERFKVAFEIALIVATQYAIYQIAGSKCYGWASILPMIVTTVVVSFYFFTNHGLKPVGDGDDALGASTSVTVPAPMNKLHVNFAYHTEHHLFPNMNSDYYPLVGELIRKHFPERYHRVPVTTAWTGLWRNTIAATRAPAR